MAVNILVFFVLLLNRVAPECSAEGTAGLGEDGEPRRMSTSSNMVSTDSASCGPIAIYSIQNGEVFPAGKDEFLKATLQRNITDGLGTSDEERMTNTTMSHRRPSTLVGHREKQNTGCVVSNI